MKFVPVTYYQSGTHIKIGRKWVPYQVLQGLVGDGLRILVDDEVRPLDCATLRVLGVLPHVVSEGDQLS